MRLTLTRRCRECGCDDRHACIDQGLPCYWVGEDLCSACARLAMVAQEELGRARKASVGGRAFPPQNNFRRERDIRESGPRRVLALRRNAGAGVAMPAGFARSAPSAYKVR